MVTTIEYLEADIRRSGHRLTAQRKSIIRAVLEEDGHSTIEQVFQRARRVDPGIDLSTIYRNLNFLCELRLLVAADLGGGKWVYEPAGEEAHHHLVCRTCGQVETIRQEEVQGFVDEVKKDHNFSIDMAHMAFFGLCEECKWSSEGVKNA